MSEKRQSDRRRTGKGGGLMENRASKRERKRKR